MRPRLKAVEFFSGIGAFAEACRQSDIEVVAAFDQSEDANRAYASNFGLKPNARNLDVVRPQDVPSADIWWMSPPCKPYTVRGKQRDDADTRAVSMKNLLSLIPCCTPMVLFVENVISFKRSRMRGALLSVLQESGYAFVELELDSVLFGTPMKRPRYFLAATRASEHVFAARIEPEPVPLKPLQEFLISIQEEGWDLADPAKILVSDTVLKRYDAGFNIVSEIDDQALAICFTSGYARSMMASGSLLRMRNGYIRRFLPEEILRMLGFGAQFSFPNGMSLETRWRLVGNSVDVRCIIYLLNSITVSNSQ